MSLAALVLHARQDALGAANVVSNPGCQMELRSGLRKRSRDTKVLHLAEFLMLAYGW